MTNYSLCIKVLLIRNIFCLHDRPSCEPKLPKTLRRPFAAGFPAACPVGNAAGNWPKFGNGCPPGKFAPPNAPDWLRAANVFGSNPLNPLNPPGSPDPPVRPLKPARDCSDGWLPPLNALKPARDCNDDWLAPLNPLKPASDGIDGCWLVAVNPPNPPKPVPVSEDKSGLRFGFGNRMEPGDGCDWTSGDVFTIVTELLGASSSSEPLLLWTAWLEPPREIPRELVKGALLGESSDCAGELRAVLNEERFGYWITFGCAKTLAANAARKKIRLLISNAID